MTTSSPSLVDLDPDAVELGVDRDRPIPARHPPWPSRRRRRERWRPASAAPAGRPRARSRRGPPRPSKAARAIGTVPPASMAARRTARQRGPGRRGDRLLDQRVEGALPDVAGDHAAQPALLLGRGPTQQVGDRGGAGRLGAAAGEAGDVLERRVDLGDRQARLAGGFRRRADAAPADPGASLQQRASEVGRDDLQVVAVGLGKGPGQGRHLRLAGPGGRDGLRGLHDPGEQHGAIVSPAADAARRR